MRLVIGSFLLVVRYEYLSGQGTGAFLPLMSNRSKRHVLWAVSYYYPLVLSVRFCMNFCVISFRAGRVQSCSICRNKFLRVPQYLLRKHTIDRVEEKEG